MNERKVWGVLLIALGAIAISVAADKACGPMIGALVLGLEAILGGGLLYITEAK